MSEQIRILFDENFGEPIVDALARVLDWYEEHPVELKHIFRFARSGEKDEVWVPKIAPGNWVVVSRDRGRRCGGKQLSAICCEHKVTHVLLSAGLGQAKQFEWIRAILSVWPQIVCACNWEKGHRYSLRYEGPDKRIVLRESMTRESARSAISVPRLGFDGRKRRVHHAIRRTISKEIPVGERLFENLHDDK